MATSAQLNRWSGIGNLTRDPLLKHQPNGNPFTLATLAVHETYNAEGQKVKKTTFIDLIAFGRLANSFAQLGRKGRGLLIEGRLDILRRTDETTKTVSLKASIIMDTFQFLDPRPTETTDPQTEAQTTEPALTQPTP